MLYNNIIFSKNDILVITSTIVLVILGFAIISLVLFIQKEKKKTCVLKNALEKCIGKE